MTTIVRTADQLLTLISCNLIEEKLTTEIITDHKEGENLLHPAEKTNDDVIDIIASGLGQFFDDTVYSPYRMELNIENNPTITLNNFTQEKQTWQKVPIEITTKIQLASHKFHRYLPSNSSLRSFEINYKGNFSQSTPILESDRKMKTISQFYTLVRNKLDLRRYPKSKVKSTGLALIDKKWYFGVMYNPKGGKKVTFIPYLSGVKASLDGEVPDEVKEQTNNDEQKRTLSSIGQTWSFDEFRHARQPIPIHKVEDRFAFQNPMPNVVDLPIKMTGDDTIYLPVEYEGMKEALSKIIAFEKVHNPKYGEYYAYLTVDKRVVQKGSYQGRIGCHVDGFQSAEQTIMEVQRNYSVFDIVPTEFVVSPMETRGLVGTVGDWYDSFTHQSQHVEVIEAKPFEINHYDAYQVQRPTVALATTDRTHLKVSFTRRQLNKLGNGINPAIDYDWTYFLKDIVSQVTHQRS